jgi:hypothetical protein
MDAAGTIGAFEMKERLLGLSLRSLPIYSLFWHHASEANRAARTIVTSVIAVAVANRFADTAALYQALGGGWWNREDRDPPKQYPFFNLTD